MKLRKFLSKALGYDGPPTDRKFILEETKEEKFLAADGDIKGDTVNAAHPRCPLKKPKKPGQNEQTANEQDTGELRHTLSENILYLEEKFHLPKNKDVVFRSFTISTVPEVSAVLLYLENMVDKQAINHSILQPLMLLSHLNPNQGANLATYQRILQSYLPSNHVRKLTIYDEVITEVTGGATVILFDGCSYGLAAETRGFAFRNIEAARTEQVVQGPQEGFNENIQDNTSLIRKHLRTEQLITEYEKVGVRNKTNVAIMYLEDLANTSLVKEVKSRVTGINADYLPESGTLEEFIEDHTFSLIPQIIKTERPDRVASMLIEGKVAIVVDNDPFVMLVPTTLWDLLHSPEDHYVRFPYGFWLRFIRLAAALLTVLLPALYVAVATFHQEMIPTDLLLSIAAAKERVPFPTIVEVLLMEFSFELIREAGVRVPGIIGPTVGIVGTLILGQAAVAASLVSPILIIVVAVTGLSSYAIPSYSAGFGLRFMRFIFIFLAATLGFFGISTGLFIVFCLLLSMNSFGVPFLAPVAPKTVRSADILIRYPVWSQEQRPDYLQTKDRQRQVNKSRRWLTKSPDQRKDGGSAGAGKQNRRD
ncbi:spore germination protein [Desulfotomaculum sp. 1211_IL3151]|uniref:spore germination protein n=1 Tax=Desulfotomaculum sp. 1211_IL3151 TaxID=3084055 RepID=UPI002FDAACFF